MVEKLPLDFVRKIYNILTNGNEDVNFYCLCLHNQNREAAMNSPIQFGINLIKLNIFCRIPFLKNKIFNEKIGQNYLSSIFVRPSISELASGMLDNSAVITDIFECAVTSLKSDEEIYNIVEKNTKVKGFAKLRKKLDNKKVPIEEIYIKINETLHSSIDYKTELSYRRQFYVPNRYVVRLLDIATFNDLKIYSYVNSVLPRDFIKSVMEEFSIYTDVLSISSESDSKFAVPEHPESTAVLSSDYKFIKKFMKYGCKPFYYRNPVLIMNKTVHPELSNDFKTAYDIISGRRLFSGLKRYSREYEFSYLCLAPVVYSCEQSGSNINEYFKNSKIDIAPIDKYITSAPDEVKSAIKDFSDDITQYFIQTEQKLKIPVNDALALYRQGEKELVGILS